MPADTLDERIAEWKLKYDEVFQVEAGNTIFVFRALSFKEFDEIAANVDSNVELEDRVVECGVLWPDDIDWDKQSPGLVSTLSDEITQVSCFDGTVWRSKDVLDEWRMKVSGIRGEMMSFVLFAMQQYKAEDLEEFTFYQLAKLVAYAEKVIYLRQISEGVDVKEPIRLVIYSQEEIDEINQERISDGGTATRGDPIAQRLMEAMG